MNKEEKQALLINFLVYLDEHKMLKDITSMYMIISKFLKQEENK